MHNHTPINLDIVAKVAQALGDLNREVVYIGGAVIRIYATDEGAELPRVTTDVDVCVQVFTLSDMETLRERLAEKSIYPDAKGTHLYRYTYKGILIDFIPFEATPFGPTNSYLKPGFDKAYETSIGDTEISVLPVAVFLATKWEAFKDRGSDPRWSHDFEDIIYILDNNVALIEDCASLAERTPQTHGEDFKYVGNYLELFTLLKKYTPAYTIESIKLFKLILFSYLFSNGDAHVKNFSLIETPLGDFRLSPAYDLLNSRLHIDDKNFALDDGLLPPHLAKEKITEHFYCLGTEAGISKKQIDKVFKVLTSKNDDVITLIEASFLNKKSKINYTQAYQRRLNKLLRS